MAKLMLRCPLAGLGACMTENGFASACLARREKKIRFDPCPFCKKGKKILAGEKCKPPEGITFFKPDGWTPAPIKYPAEQPYTKWPRGKTHYPFASMDVGAVFEGLAENKQKIRFACAAIARRHGKKFVSKVKDDKIFVTRIK